MAKAHDDITNRRGFRDCVSCAHFKISVCQDDAIFRCALKYDRIIPPDCWLTSWLTTNLGQAWRRMMATDCADYTKHKTKHKKRGSQCASTHASRSRLT